MKSQNTAIKIKSLIAAQVVRNKIDWWIDRLNTLFHHFLFPYEKLLTKLFGTYFKI